MIQHKRQKTVRTSLLAAASLSVMIVAAPGRAQTAPVGPPASAAPATPKADASIRVRNVRDRAVATGGWVDFERMGGLR